MSCKILWKQPFGCCSPYQRRHVNSCKYSCRKLLFVFPFIFFNFSFAALQLLSAYCVWTPDAGSTRLTEWLKVSQIKPRSLWILLYAAHWSEWTIVPGRTFRQTIGKSVAASSPNKLIIKSERFILRVEDTKHPPASSSARGGSSIFWKWGPNKDNQRALARLSSALGATF